MAQKQLKDRLANELRMLKEKGMHRSLKTLHARDGARLEWNEKPYINLSSNDYLGLAFDKALQAEFYSGLDVDNIAEHWGLGSASSRLLTGNSPSYQLLEGALASLYGKERALVFNSGYHANIGILPALAGKGDLVLSDKLNHASIIDGVRLCAADVQRYRHLDTEHLESILKQKRSAYRHCFIVTESIFSMDGDCADLQELVRIKEQYGCQLYVDEAHAVACRGKHGLGICEETATVADIDFIVGTFGKAYASQGAFLVADAVYADYLVNAMRSFIFTTALPEISVYWTYFIATKLEALQPKREYLWKLSAKVRERLQQIGYGSQSESNIIPVMVGAAEDAVILAEHLQAKGLLVFPIRPPTVPAGTSRLRLSMCAHIAEGDIVSLWEVLQNGGQKNEFS